MTKQDFDKLKPSEQQALYMMGLHTVTEVSTEMNIKLSETELHEQATKRAHENAESTVMVQRAVTELQNIQKDLIKGLIK